jgi:hypothetical protein
LFLLSGMCDPMGGADTLSFPAAQL